FMLVICWVLSSLVMLLLFFFFFFSSRRRHTRSDRDWSSDVCSSDLVVVVRVELAGEDLGQQRVSAHHHRRDDHSTEHGRPAQWRSEERRVGKECRSRWAR